MVPQLESHRRTRPFDVVVDLQGWLKSQLLCLLSGARSRVGLQKGNELGFHILEHGVPDRPRAHVADLYLEVARLLGAQESRGTGTRPYLVQGALLPLDPDNPAECGSPPG